MKAITTKYCGPTNKKGSKILAKAFPGKGGSLYYEYDDALNLEQNHQQAALQLAERLNWGGFWVAGYVEQYNLFAWVNDFRIKDSKDSWFII